MVNVFVQAENSSLVSEDTSSNFYLEKIQLLKQKIGKTPLVHIDNVNGSSIYAKLEYYNPLSHSVKDRPAVYMLEAAIKQGLVTSDNVTFVEASSGNLGIAYGRAGKFLGLKTLIVIPSVVGEKTFKRISETGTAVEKTPDGYCPLRNERDGAIAKVKDLFLDDPNMMWLDQYSNQNNFRAHIEGTGPEIWSQTEKRVTNIVLGVGTGGTMVGITRYLKAENPEIESVAVQPQEDHHIQGLRNFSESLEPEIVRSNRDAIDDWMKVSDADAFEATEYLWRKGYLVGTSSGLNYFAARKIAKENKGSTVVTLFPDTCLNSFKLTQEYIVGKSF
ncbi:MAG: cysteine synthase family protein [Candidatus Bathyarchaeum sp.]|nr:MAG: cysteine synthase family protein [Candidatus Bathyarchaeum sp.]